MSITVNFEIDRNINSQQDAEDIEKWLEYELGITSEISADNAFFGEQIDAKNLNIDY